jgi:hypothetical protein
MSIESIIESLRKLQKSQNKLGFQQIEKSVLKRNDESKRNIVFQAVKDF